MGGGDLKTSELLAGIGSNDFGSGHTKERITQKQGEENFRAILGEEDPALAVLAPAVRQILERGLVGATIDAETGDILIQP